MHWMDFGSVLRKARSRHGLSQRALSARTGVAQPTIARIERGVDTPRLDTAERLLSGCGWTLTAIRIPAIDMSLVRELLAMPAIERVRLLSEEAAALDAFDAASRP